MDLGALLRAQPKMHTGMSGQPFSWQLADDLLYFIDAHVDDRSRTLEIGAGVSTLLFALKGATHLCIVPAEDEVDRIKAFCREHEISLANVTFKLDRSDRCLPALSLSGLDFVLLDGAHGFPIPFIDWYYTAGRLKNGGFLAIDDTEIWTGHILKMFLLAEPEWTLEADYGPRSAVFRKLKDGGLGRNEWDQPYIVEQTLNFMFAEYPGDVEGIRQYVRRDIFDERKRRAASHFMVAVSALGPVWDFLEPPVRTAASVLPGPIKRTIKRVLGIPNAR